jgi:hypothetical protein
MSLLALPVIVGLVLSIPRSCVTAIGDGSVSVPLVIVVVDETTGKPIENAWIRLPDRPGSGITLEATTSSDGRARILLDTYFSEGINDLFMYRVYRRVCYIGEVEVSAEGYRTSKFLLEDRTNEPRFHYDAAPPLIVVGLRYSHQGGKSATATR